MISPFLTDQIAVTLDAVGSRYSRRPSEIVGFPPNTGRGLMFDINVVKIVQEITAMAKSTVQGKAKTRSAKWDKDALKEASMTGR